MYMLIKMMDFFYRIVFNLISLVLKGAYQLYYYCINYQFNYVILLFQFQFKIVSGPINNRRVVYSKIYLYKITQKYY